MTERPQQLDRLLEGPPLVGVDLAERPRGELRGVGDPQPAGGLEAASEKVPSGAGARSSSTSVVPEATSWNSAVSATRRARIPFTLSPCQALDRGATDTRPRWGLSPNSPHQAAGIRIEPAPSEPSAAPTSPAATAAPLPPEEPPGVRCRSHGLRVAPQVAVSVNGQMVNSGTLVLPMITAPASRSLRTTSASCSAGRSLALVPHLVGSPATSMSSLTAIGTPSSGRRSPPARRASACSASIRTRSSSTLRNAFRTGFRRAIRSR